MVAPRYFRNIKLLPCERRDIEISLINLIKIKGHVNSFLLVFFLFSEPTGNYQGAFNDLLAVPAAVSEFREHHIRARK